MLCSSGGPRFVGGEADAEHDSAGAGQHLQRRGGCPDLGQALVQRLVQSGENGGLGRANGHGAAFQDVVGPAARRAQDISLDECAALSAPLGEAIEAAGLLPDAYVLEVSSPGVSDELQEDRDFRSFRGFPIQVEFCDAKGNTVQREGLLLERDDTTVHLNIQGRIQRIPRSAVNWVRLTTPTD